MIFSLDFFETCHRVERSGMQKWKTRVLVTTQKRERSPLWLWGIWTSQFKGFKEKKKKKLELYCEIGMRFNRFRSRESTIFTRRRMKFIGLTVLSWRRGPQLQPKGERVFFNPIIAAQSSNSAGLSFCETVERSSYLVQKTKEGGISFVRSSLGCSGKKKKISEAAVSFCGWEEKVSCVLLSKGGERALLGRKEEAHGLISLLKGDSRMVRCLFFAKLAEKGKGIWTLCYCDKEQHRPPPSHCDVSLSSPPLSATWRIQTANPCSLLSPSGDALQTLVMNKDWYWTTLIGPIRHG